MAPKPRDEMERFWDSVFVPRDVLTGCWTWLRATDQDGYGLFKRGPEGERRMVRAHRFSHAAFNGATELQVLHSCNNPSCVNPAHLRSGTHEENMIDRKEAGHYPEGVAHQNVTLSADKVRAIRADTDRSYVELATAFGVGKNTVYRIKSRAAHWSKGVA